MLKSLIFIGLVAVTQAFTLTPSSSTQGTDVAVVFFQGASAPVSGYQPFAEKLQSVASDHGIRLFFSAP